MRYIHFMAIASPIFNTELIKLVVENCDSSEHLFLVSNEANYDAMLPICENLRYEPQMDMRCVEKYAEEAEVIILHSLFLTERDLRHMELKIARKIVWCVWGHDLYEKIPTHTLSRKFKLWRRNRTISCFRGIVIGFEYDVHRIRKNYGKRVPVYKALYGSGYYQSDVDAIVANSPRENRSLNIMIGHSGHSFLKHHKHFTNLLAYKNEDIVIHLVMSYGESHYIPRAVRSAINLFGKDKVRVYADFMQWNEYVSLMNQMDIAIFDFDHQAAFGNIILLSYLKKKLYLSRTGVMYKALKEQNCTVYDADQIGLIPFEEFKATTQDTDDVTYSQSLLSKEKIVAQWKNMFQQVL